VQFSARAKLLVCVHSNIHFAVVCGMVLLASVI